MVRGAVVPVDRDRVREIARALRRRPYPRSRSASTPWPTEGNTMRPRGRGLHGV